MSQFETPTRTALVVDDDASTRLLLRAWLEADGFRVEAFASGAAALEGAAPLLPSVALVDLGLEDMPGIELIRHLRARDAHLAVVVVTAERSLESAIEAMRAGAYDYVTKPIDRDRLGQAVSRAAERCALGRKVDRLESALGREELPGWIGESVNAVAVERQIRRVAASDVTVCLFGESGSGKEVAARALHGASARKRGPFVAINCAAIPTSLQESELFGHEKGSFTGAVGTHKGRFEQASGGTLFLDELGEMSLATQAALLRTLEARTVRRVGGVVDLPVDVRVVCATHRDLRAEVDAGRFREDLYYRLVVYPIRIPPLRERSDDLPLLVGHFLRDLAAQAGRPAPRVEPEALEALARHAWPGNVRELRNVVHRALLSCEGEEITLADLPPDVRAAVLPSLPPPVREAVLETAPRAPAEARGAAPDPASDVVIPLAELERRAIQHALRVAKGSVGKAAKLLGMGRATLYRRVVTLELDGASGEEDA